MSLIGKSVGNYRVIAKIGEGGMGSVYLGEHPLIGKRVAVKVLHEELAQKEDIVSRFFTEAKAVNEIGHPNIVDVVDFGKMKDASGGDVVYFVMEFLDGEGLNTRLKREGVSIAEAIQIGDQCASALAASHAKHIVHRDLKPENIYLVHRGADRNYVKLLDFGIAKLTGGDSSMAQHKTRTGLVIGTPSYMSPEQCEGKGNIDWRSDVYSLGIVMYEMLTGRVPFPGEGFGEVLVAHLTKPAPLPSTIRQDVPAALESIVMHAIEKQRDRRFQSMDEFRAALADPGGHLASHGQATAGSPSTLILSSAPVPQAGPRAGAPGATAMVDRSTGGPRAITGQGPRPTTLTGSAGEVTGATGSGGKSRAPLFAMVGLLVGGAGLGGYFFLEHKKAQEASKTAAVVTAPPQETRPTEEVVEISIESTPAGAKVYRAGRTAPIGVTPFSLKVKKDDGDFDVMVKMDGFKDEVKTVTSQRDHDMVIALSKIEKPVEAAVVVAPATHKDSHHHSSSGSDDAPAKKTGKTGGKGKAGDRDGTLEPTF